MAKVIPDEISVQVPGIAEEEGGQQKNSDDRAIEDLEQRKPPASSTSLFELHVTKRAGVACLAARPGRGRPLLLLGDTKGQVSLWDARSTGEQAAAERDVGSKVVAASWSPSGSCFAVACEGSTNKASPKKDGTSQSTLSSATTVAHATGQTMTVTSGTQGCVIYVWQVYDGDDSCRTPCHLDQLLGLERDWDLKALSFCSNGCRLAVAASTPIYALVIVLDIDKRDRGTQMEENRLLLPRVEVRSLSWSGLGPFDPGTLAVAADRSILLWKLVGSPAGKAAPRKDCSFVEVSYGLGGMAAGQDVTLCSDEGENQGLRILGVAEAGPAFAHGVRGDCGWLLVGSMSKSRAGELHILKSSKDAQQLLLQQDVRLVFQSPISQLQTLPSASEVKCATVSPDGTLLAVGRVGRSGAEVPNTSAGRGANSARIWEQPADSKATLVIWSLETQELWPAREVHISSSVQTLCWASSCTVVLAHNKGVALVDIEAAAVLREWNFMEIPKFVTSVPGRTWVAVGFRSVGRNDRCCSLFPLDACGECCLPTRTCIDPAAHLASCSASGQVLAVAGADLGMIAVSEPGSDLYGKPDSTTSHATKSSLSASFDKKKPNGLSIWKLGAMESRKLPNIMQDYPVIAVALGEDDLLAVCFREDTSTTLKVFRLNQGDAKCQEICTEPEMKVVAASGNAERGIVVSAGASKGRVLWLQGFLGKGSGQEPREPGEPREPRRADLSCIQGSDVLALDFLPQGSWLAGTVSVNGVKPSGKGDISGNIACIWDLTEPGIAQLAKRVNMDMEGSATCLAFGLDFSAGALQKTHSRTTGPSSPRRHQSRGSIQSAGPAVETCPPALLATGGACGRVLVYEVRYGFVRHAFDVSAVDKKRPDTWKAAVTAVRFAPAGSLLVAGDNAGRVHIFGLQRSGQHYHVKVNEHRVLWLAGSICELVLKEDKLTHAVSFSQSHDGGATGGLASQASEQGRQMLTVYDLVNPSLEFMLPDLKLQENDASSAFRAQLEILPSLLHQRLLPQHLGWPLLHLCASRGLHHHVRLLVKMSASPLIRDVQGRNAIDVAVQHHEFGTAEELLMVLMELDGGPKDDDVEETKLGQTIVANALPGEQSALTRTVVRLLRYRMAALPEFLDHICRGAPRQPTPTRPGEQVQKIPVRAAMEDGQLRIRAYRAPVYRSSAKELRDLVPPFKEQGAPERPAAMRVWYLRGILDNDVGLIAALKRAGHDEIMRTTFVQVVLDFKWKSGVSRLFLWDLALYVVFILCFASWCLAGQEACPPPKDVWGDFQHAWGITFQVNRVVLLLFLCLTLYEETKQLWFEVVSGQGRCAAVAEYFNVWNMLDLLRVTLVGVAVIWSWQDREGAFLGEGRNLLAFTTLVVCSRLLSFLRAFSDTGHLVRTLLTIFWDIRMYFALIALVSMSFVFAFHLIFNQPNSIEGFWASAWFVFSNGVTGNNVDAPEGGDHDTVISQVLLTLLGSVLLVVMMNFLIAIMGDSYEKVQEKAEVARNMMRLELVYEAEVSSSSLQEAKEAYIFTCEGVRYSNAQRWSEDADGKDPNRWEGRVKQVEKAVRKESKAWSSVLAEQTKRLGHLEDRVLDVERNFHIGQARIQEALERILDFQTAMAYKEGAQNLSSAVDQSLR
eukprot:TRINITY_DN24234_c0_g1_i2.p1 TRINITY_DN24234_c0_g1~~TRINITY_DN24234_c0_g1_i2.p1  ORF type:complete len:1639 (+),score=332.73 TRINITY_DN24234_c0_g1_i2:140-5056(+)